MFNFNLFSNVQIALNECANGLGPVLESDLKFRE